MRATHTRKGIHSLVLMAVIPVLALLEMSLVQQTHAKIQPVQILLATTKTSHTIQEIYSLVLMDVILVHVLLEMSFVHKIHAIKHVIMKVSHTMKEIHSLVLMDVIIAHALLEMSLAQKIHVTKQLLASTEAKPIMQEIHSFLWMVINLVLALQDWSSVLL